MTPVTSEFRNLKPRPIARKLGKRKQGVRACQLIIYDQPYNHYQGIKDKEVTGRII
jgi:hypothetical protein